MKNKKASSKAGNTGTGNNGNGKFSAEEAKNLGHRLPCPNCQVMNTISRVNDRLKCAGCGMPLRAVRVTKNMKRRTGK